MSCVMPCDDVTSCDDVIDGVCAAGRGGVGDEAQRSRLPDDRDVRDLWRPPAAGLITYKMAVI